MSPYAVIDLHCDTLTGGQDPLFRRNTLDDPHAALALSRLPAGVHWGQCFAIFLPDECTPDQAWARYRRARRAFVRQMAHFSPLVAPCRTAADLEAAWAQNRTAALLTVENGSVLAGRLHRVEELARDGVRMLTLTWNGENEIGSGCATRHGLSPFGRAVLPKLEACGILVDVSHLNDPGFAQVLQLARRPFVATHSNARAVCPHPRNLTDDQIREMAARRCLIGLNYCDPFLREGGSARPDDLLRHVDHFLDLGAEDCLALGSDFDGADLPDFLRGPEQAAALSELFLRRGYAPALCDNLLYGNALRFFRGNLR